MKISFIKPILLFLFFSSMAIQVNAQSIDFVENKKWAEVVAQAKLEKKLIFVDVFTDWCGPCLNMEENVFILPKVRSFYNTNFVNFRIDAEKGEGVDFRAKYQVSSYPTYLFINPETLEIVHRSSSRQDQDVFIFTGESALKPEMQSTYLEKKYKDGDRNPELLKSYAAYLSSCYQTEKLNKIVDAWFAIPTVDYTSEVSMNFLEKYVKDIDQKAFINLVENRQKFTSIYGKERVDSILCDLYLNRLTAILMNSIWDKDRFSQKEFDLLLSTVQKQDFIGKSFLLDKITVLNLLRMEQYNEAAKIADELPSKPELTEKDILDFYQQLARLAERTIENPVWIKHALTYSQYIAYNTEDRTKAEAHYNYATLLEKAIKTSPAGKDIAPASLLDRPKYGKKTYNMRSSKLKAKPTNKTVDKTVDKNK